DDVEQRRFAGAVRPDDRARLARLDVEVDVPQRVDAAEILGHVGDLEDHFSHDLDDYSAGCSTGPALRRGARRNRPAMRCAPSTIPPGRKITISMNTRPRVSCQPGPTNRRAMPTTMSSTREGRNPN